MPKKLIKIIAVFLVICLFFEQSSFAQVMPQLSPVYFSQPSFLIPDKFRPLHLRSLEFSPQTASLQVLLDKGDIKEIDQVVLKETTKKLMDYFLIGLSLPNDSFWVNLRPDQPDNIIDQYLQKTDMGKVMLEADLNLKKDLAQATSPRTKEGKEYWDKLYLKAQELFGGEQASLPTFTRPWIVPGEIIIRQSKSNSLGFPVNAYIYKATLKVMLEQDYLKEQTPKIEDRRLKELNDYSSELIRRLIIPKLTLRVNSSKVYAPLRQVYYSLILAQWFKNEAKNGFRFSVLGSGKDTKEDLSATLKPYIDRIDRKDLNKLTSQQSWSKDAYFKQYKQSFQKGEYNECQTINTAYGQTIRQYTSGGIVLQPAKGMITLDSGINLPPGQNLVAFSLAVGVPQSQVSSELEYRQAVYNYFSSLKTLEAKQKKGLLASGSPEGKKAIIGAYFKLMGKLIPVLELDGKQVTFLYPFQGPDAIPAIFRKTYPLNTEVNDFDLGEWVVRDILGEKKELNIMNRQQALDAQDRNNYKIVRDSIDGLCVLILKGFENWSRYKKDSAFSRGLLKYIVEDVLRKGDKLLILEQKELELFQSISTECEMSILGGEGLALKTQDNKVLNVGMKDLTSNEWKSFRIPNLVAVIEKKDGGQKDREIIIGKHAQKAGSDNANRGWIENLRDRIAYRQFKAMSLGIGLISAVMMKIGQITKSYMLKGDNNVKYPVITKSQSIRNKEVKADLESLKAQIKGKVLTLSNDTGNSLWIYNIEGFNSFIAKIIAPEGILGKPDFENDIFPGVERAERLGELAADTAVVRGAEVVIAGERKTVDLLLQRKLVPLDKEIRELAGQGRTQEIKLLLEEFKAINIEIWKKGLIIPDILLFNFGYNEASGQIQLIDFSDLVEEYDQLFAEDLTIAYLENIDLLKNIAPEVARYYRSTELSIKDLNRVWNKQISGGDKEGLNSRRVKDGGKESQEIIIGKHSPKVGSDQTSGGQIINKVKSLFGLEYALDFDLVKVIEEDGFTIRRVKLPTNIADKRIKPRVDLLKNELVRMADFSLSTVDLLYQEGRLLAIFPVFPDDIARKFIEFPSREVRYLNLAPYYFTMPKFGAPGARESWEGFAKRLEADMRVVYKYKNRKDSAVKYEVNHEQSPYFYAQVHKNSGEIVTEQLFAIDEERYIFRSPWVTLDKLPGKEQIIIPVLPTVYSMAHHWSSDKGYYKYLVESADIKDTDTVLVVGPGTGVELWIANLFSRQKKYAIGKTPIEKENAELTARAGGFSEKIEVITADNIISSEGEPRFKDIKFDKVLWNMPIYNPYTKDRIWRQTASLPMRGDMFWDNDFEGEALRRFSQGLPSVLSSPGGRAILWNVLHLEKPNDEQSDIVKKIIETGGSYKSSENQNKKIFDVSRLAFETKAYGSFYIVSWPESNYRPALADPAQLIPGPHDEMAELLAQAIGLSSGSRTGSVGNRAIGDGGQAFPQSFGRIYANAEAIRAKYAGKKVLVLDVGDSLGDSPGWSLSGRGNYSLYSYVEKSLRELKKEGIILGVWSAAKKEDISDKFLKVYPQIAKLLDFAITVEDYDAPSAQEMKKFGLNNCFYYTQIGKPIDILFPNAVLIDNGYVEILAGRRRGFPVINSREIKEVDDFLAKVRAAFKEIAITETVVPSGGVPRGNGPDGGSMGNYEVNMPNPTDQEKNYDLWGSPEIHAYYEDSRRDIRPATQLIVQRITEQYLQEVNNILEIGSGLGELAKLVSDDIKGKLLQSDRQIRLLSNNPVNTPKLGVDIYHIPFKSEKVPAIASFAVLDTLFDLRSAAQEMRRVLTPNGIMVGFIDLAPSHEVMMHSFPEDILFPASIELPGTTGYYRVNREELQRQIKLYGKELSSQWLKVLEQYRLNPVDLFNLISSNLPVSEQEQIANKFKKILETLKVKYEVIEDITVLKGALERELKHAGFKIVMSELSTASVDKKRADVSECPAGANVIRFCTGDLWYERDLTLPPGIVRIISTIYVVVAKKNGTGTAGAAGDDGASMADNVLSGRNTAQEEGVSKGSAHRQARIQQVASGLEPILEKISQQVDLKTAVSLPEQVLFNLPAFVSSLDDFKELCIRVGEFIGDCSENGITPESKQEIIGRHAKDIAAYIVRAEDGGSKWEELKAKGLWRSYPVKALSDKDDTGSRLLDWVFPKAVESLPNGSFVVGDSGALHGAAIYNPDGSVIFLRDEKGSYLKEETVRDLAVDEPGNIFAVTSEGIIRAYSMEGKLLGSYKIKNDYLPRNSSGIIGDLVAFQGKLYFSVQESGELRELDLSTGEEKTFWGQGGQERTFWNQGMTSSSGLMNLTINKKAGVIYITGGRFGQGSSIRTFDIATQKSGEIKYMPGLFLEAAVAVDSNEVVYMIDDDKRIIWVLPPQGELGYLPTYISKTMSSIAVDKDNNLLIGRQGGFEVISQEAVKAMLVKASASLSDGRTGPSKAKGWKSSWQMGGQDGGRKKGGAPSRKEGDELWRSQQVHDYYDKSRRYFAPLNELIVQGVAAEYLQAAESILEIGSGRGTFAKMLQESIRGKLIQSDRDANLLQSNSVNTPKVVIDAYHIKMENGTVPAIASYAVLDTFFDLKSAVGEMYRVLQPGGKMVGFVDLAPSHEALMHSFPKDILFPASVDFQGIPRGGFLRVDRQEFKKRFQLYKSSKHIGQTLLDLLEEYSNDPVAFYTSLQSKFSLEEHHQICEVFEDALKDMGIGYEVLNDIEVFRGNLEKELRQAGFKVLVSRFATASTEGVDKEYLPKFPDDTNVLLFHTGSQYLKKDDSISPGKATVTSTIYVVVAEKPGLATAGIEINTAKEEKFTKESTRMQSRFQELAREFEFILNEVSQVDPTGAISVLVRHLPEKWLFGLSVDDFKGFFMLMGVFTRDYKENGITPELKREIIGRHAKVIAAYMVKLEEAYHITDGGRILGTAAGSDKDGGLLGKDKRIPNKNSEELRKPAGDGGVENQDAVSMGKTVLMKGTATGPLIEKVNDLFALREVELFNVIYEDQAGDMTIRRVKVPEKLPARWEVIHNRLLGTKNLKIEMLDLLYRQGRLIAVFPAYEEKFGKLYRDEVLALGRYFITASYYFSVPPFAEEGSLEEWKRFVSQFKKDMDVIRAYKTYHLPPETRGINDPAYAYSYVEVDKNSGAINAKKVFSYDGELELNLESIFQGDSAGKYRHIIPVLPTVSPIATNWPHDNKYYRHIYQHSGFKKGDKILVVGPRAGLEAWLMVLLTGEKVYAVGINPREIENLKMTAALIGFSDKLVAKVEDNIISGQGEPRFPGIVFDGIVWNMPNYISKPDDGRPYKSDDLAFQWDGDYKGSILRRFARGLKLLLKNPTGKAIIWNTPYYENDTHGTKYDLVKKIVESAGGFGLQDQDAAGVFDVHALTPTPGSRISSNVYVITWPQNISDVNRMSGPVEDIEHQRKENQGWSSFRTFEYFDKTRQYFRSLIGATVQKIALKYLQNADRVLEVGSGPGEFGKLLQPDIRGKLIQTDRSMFLLKGNRLGTPKMGVDIYHIPYKDGEMPAIVSYAALDTLYDLKGGVKEISRVLEPGGVMINFLDLAPNQDVLMSAFPDSILFPFISQFKGMLRLGFLRVNRAELERNLQTHRKSLTPKDLLLMAEYIADPAEALSVYNSRLTPEKLERLYAVFQKILDTMQIKYEKVNDVEFFKEQLEKELRDSGLEIIVSDYVTETEVMKRGKLGIKLHPEANVFALHTGNPMEGIDLSLASGDVRIMSTIYVVVAKKPGSTARDSKKSQGQEISSEQTRVQRLAEEVNPILEQAAQLDLNAAIILFIKNLPKQFLDNLSAEQHKDIFNRFVAFRGDYSGQGITPESKREVIVRHAKDIADYIVSVEGDSSRADGGETNAEETAITKEGLGGIDFRNHPMFRQTDGRSPINLGGSPRDSVSTAGIGPEYRVFNVGGKDMKIFMEDWNTKTNYYADFFITRMPDIVARAVNNKHMRGDYSPLKVLELGVGRGVLSLSVALIAPDDARIIGVDTNSNAPNLVMKNAAINGVAHKIEVRVGNLFEPIGKNEKFDLILFDLPHIPVDPDRYAAELAQKAPEFLAINGGPAGRHFIDAVITGAPNYLEPGGMLVFDQPSFTGVGKSLQMLRDNGLNSREAAKMSYPVADTRFTKENKEYIQETCAVNCLPRPVFEKDSRGNDIFYLEIIEGSFPAALLSAGAVLKENDPNGAARSENTGQLNDVKMVPAIDQRPDDGSASMELGESYQTRGGINIKITKDELRGLDISASQIQDAIASGSGFPGGKSFAFDNSLRWDQMEWIKDDIKNLILDKVKRGDKTLIFYEIGLGDEFRESEQIIGALDEVLSELKSTGNSDLSGWRIELVGIDTRDLSGKYRNKVRELNSVLKEHNIIFRFEQGSTFDLSRLEEISQGIKGDYIFDRHADYFNYNAMEEKLSLKAVDESLNDILGNYISARNLLHVMGKKDALFVVEPIAGMNDLSDNNHSIFLIPGATLLDANHLSNLNLPRNSYANNGTGILKIQDPEGLSRAGIKEWLELMDNSRASKDGGSNQLIIRAYTYPAADVRINIANPNDNYFQTSAGAVSVGMSMGYRSLLPDETNYPRIIIAPRENWVGKDGANIMQLYFTTVINKAFHKRNTVIVCRPDQRERIRQYLKLGNPYDLPNIAGYSQELISRLRREAIYLDDRSVDAQGKPQRATHYPDMVDFVEFSDGKANIGGITITDKADGTFLVADPKQNMKTVLQGNDLQELTLEMQGVNKLSEIPELGVTFLGTSSAMDPNGLPSNQIVWAGKQHILIDVNTPTLTALSALGLTPRDITHVAITHMHEDHVAGLLSYMEWCKRDGHPIRLVAEPGIYRLFKEQAKQILNKEIDQQYKIEFLPLTFYSDITLGKGQESVLIESAPAFHGTPTMMLRFTYKGQTISHSSDTAFDPERFKQILQNTIPENIRAELVELAGAATDTRVFDEARADEISGFLLKANQSGRSPEMFIFEGGSAAPYDKNGSNHTTPWALQMLPEEVQRKIFINHTTMTDVDAFMFQLAVPFSTVEIKPDGSKELVRAKGDVRKSYGQDGGIIEDERNRNNSSLYAEALQKLGEIIERKNLQKGIITIEGMAGSGKNFMAELVTANGIKNRKIGFMDIDLYLPRFVEELSGDVLIKRPNGDLIIPLNGDFSDECNFDGFINELKSLSEKSDFVIIAGLHVPLFFTRMKLPPPDIRIVMQADLKITRRSVIVRDGYPSKHVEASTVYKEQQNLFNGVPIDLIIDRQDIAKNKLVSHASSNLHFVSSQIYGKVVKETAFEVSPDVLFSLADEIEKEAITSGLTKDVDNLSYEVSDVEAMIAAASSILRYLFSAGDLQPVVTIRRYEKGLEVVVKSAIEEVFKAKQFFSDDSPFRPVRSHVPEIMAFSRDYWFMRSFGVEWREEWMPASGTIYAIACPSEVPEIGIKFDGTDLRDSDGGKTNYKDDLLNLQSSRWQQVPKKFVTNGIDGGVITNEKGGIDSSTAKSSPSIPGKEVSGIDFRSLPIVTQPVPAAQLDLPAAPQSLIPLAELDNEWKQIQEMVSRGDIPSSAKIKEYILSCCRKGDITKDIEKVLVCISEIMRLEEDYAIACEPGFVQLLAMLESGKFPQ